MDNSTLLSLIGIIIAINAAFSSAVFFYHGQLIKKKDKSILELQSSNERLSEIVDSIIVSMVTDDIRERTYEAVLERLLVATNHKNAITDRILSAFANNSIESDRALNELMLFSDDENKKIASFRQLSESCGTIDSIEKMITAKAYEPNCNSNIYRECIETLKSRLRNT